jgi:CheY-like chemotaxis protein
VMDGFTLIERLRDEPELSTIPVIIITGGRADERERAERMGVSAFLHKPVQFGEILETIIWLAGQIAEAEARAELEAALSDEEDDLQ